MDPMNSIFICGLFGPGKPYPIYLQGNKKLDRKEVRNSIYSAMFPSFIYRGHCFPLYLNGQQAPSGSFGFRFQFALSGKAMSKAESGLAF